MAFITVEELSTHLYGELVAAISREDEDIPQRAIDGAVYEVKGYLGDFDTDSIFSETGNDRHPLILIYTKDIAVWHFIVLANPNIEINLREKRYDNAIAWLKGVQARKITPDLPLKPTEGVSGQTGVGRVIQGSNPPRRNHF